jgi:large subunit ribosomal protein L7/L12
MAEEKKQEEKKEEEKNQTTAENKAEEKKEEKKAPSGKFADLIKQIEELSVLELSELVKELEERFGVSAAAPVAVTAVGATGEAGADSGAEEKASYTVHLAAAGDQKIAVIKAVREITELGLKDAKDMVDQAPKDIKNDVPKEEAEEMKKKLEEAGATVELK